MYQFTTSTIINSNVDSNGSTPKYSGNSSAFRVTRVNTFLKDKIVSVYKRPYAAGVKEVATVTVPTLTTGEVARLVIDLRMSQNTFSDFANTYLYFKKPIVVEVVATGTAATDATALVAQLNGLKDRFGHGYVIATVVGADITLTATDVYQRFHSVTVEELVLATNSIVQYNSVVKATGSVSVAGAIGFGDDDWMMRIVKVPTLDNLRPFGINREELPVIGGNYTQYTLRYVTDKDHNDGVWSGANSVTTHVFYVKSDLVAGFEAALANTGLVVDTVGVAVTGVTITSGNLDLSDFPSTGYQITYTTTPSGVTGAVWEANAAGNVDAALADADFTKVTVTPTGQILLASGHGLAATDKIGVKVTIDGFTTTAQITVQA